MVATAVVTESQTSKVYRLPTAHETACAARTEAELERTFSDVPFGLPTEPIAEGGSRSGGGSPFTVHIYGLDQMQKLFSSRQLLTLGTLVRKIRSVTETSDAALPSDWREPIAAYLAILIDKTADYNSTICTWHNSGEKIGHTFARFALPITWDVAELATINEVGGSLFAQLDWVARYIDTALQAFNSSSTPVITRSSATQAQDGYFDAIITDPPYYDAIPYSDCMDFFYVWIKRIVYGTCIDPTSVFSADTSPKWDGIVGDNGQTCWMLCAHTSEHRALTMLSITP